MEVFGRIGQHDRIIDTVYLYTRQLGRHTCKINLPIENPLEHLHVEQYVRIRRQVLPAYRGESC